MGLVLLQAELLNLRLGLLDLLDHVLLVGGRVEVGELLVELLQASA